MGHLGLINVAKHLIDLLNVGVGTVHSTRYRAGPTARKFSTTEIFQVTTKKVSKPASTKRAAPIVITPKEDSFLSSCVDSSIVDAVTIHDSYPSPA